MSPGAAAFLPAAAKPPREHGYSPARGRINLLYNRQAGVWGAEQPGGSVESQEQHLEQAPRVLGRLGGHPAQPLLFPSLQQSRSPARPSPASTAQVMLQTPHKLGDLCPPKHTRQRAGRAGQRCVQSLPSSHSPQCCCGVMGFMSRQLQDHTEVLLPV